MKPRGAVVYIVVSTLSATVLAGMYSVHVLIIAKADAALIAIMSGFTGTALGLLGSILSRTGSTPDHPAPVPIATADGQAISPTNPLPTDQQS